MSPKNRTQMLKYVKRGALAGTGLGALAGAGLGADASSDSGSRAGSIVKGLGIGAGLGAMVGGAAGARMHILNRAEKMDSQQWRRRFRQRQRRSDREWNESFSSRFRDHFGGGFRPRTPDHTPHLKSLGLDGNEKTKAEVQKKYRDLAMKHHPDRGGSHQKMQEVNRAMTDLKKSDWFNKLSSAFTAGFEDIYV